MNRGDSYFRSPCFRLLEDAPSTAQVREYAHEEADLIGAGPGGVRPARVEPGDVIPGPRGRTTRSGPPRLEGMHRGAPTERARGGLEALYVKGSLGLADNYIDGLGPNQLLSRRWTPHALRCASSKGAKPSGAVVCRAGVSHLAGLWPFFCGAGQNAAKALRGLCR